jgi:CubicO group peptidase (beta-lactamase class C family)
LTSDVKSIPKPFSGEMQDDIEILAPAFCDPGSRDRSNGTRTCTREDVLRAIATRPLAFEPWTRPLYSNTGFNLLGWAIASAGAKGESLRVQEPDEHMDHMEESVTMEDMLKRDVFKPLEMGNTSFWVPLENRDNVAVPSNGVPTMIDWDFTSAFNPSGCDFISR